MRNQELFNLMARDHGLTLLESEMHEIEIVVARTLATDRRPESESAPDAVVGRCVEVGDDDEGQARLIIHTTREQLMNFGRNLAYVDVEVTLHSPNDKLTHEAGAKDL